MSWSIIVTTDDDRIHVVPAYDTEQHAMEDVKKIHRTERILWKLLDTGTYGVPNTWACVLLHQIRWCHVVPDGNYGQTTTGKLVG